MNEEITASTVFDAPTMIPAYRWHGRRYPLQQCLSWLFVPFCIAVYCFGNPPTQWKSNLDFYPVAIILAGVGFIFWSRTIGQKPRITKSIKQMPDHKKPVSWIIKENGFEQRIGESYNFTEWASLYESVAFPEGALLYPQKGLFYWLPKSAFSDSNYERLVQLLTAKTTHSRVG